VIYYEKPAYPADPHLWPAGFSWQAVESDINYVLRTYANRPGYLHIDSRPVVFVYMPGATSSDVQQWVTVRNDTRTYIDLSVDPTQMSGVSPGDLDSWHLYNPTVRYQSAGSYYASVSPGFWRDQTSCTPSCSMQLARDPVAFDTAVRELAQAQTTWKLIETWNEWGEGTSVEPGTEVTQQTDLRTAIVPASPQRADGCYGDAYVNVLARDLPEHGQRTTWRAAIHMRSQASG
jgi:hypothetical protein